MSGFSSLLSLSNSIWIGDKNLRKEILRKFEWRKQVFGNRRKSRTFWGGGGGYLLVRQETKICKAKFQKKNRLLSRKMLPPSDSLLCFDPGLLSKVSGTIFRVAPFSMSMIPSTLKII
jgi:hypothetical protein